MSDEPLLRLDLTEREAESLLSFAYIGGAMHRALRMDIPDGSVDDGMQATAKLTRGLLAEQGSMGNFDKTREMEMQPEFGIPPCHCGESLRRSRRGEPGYPDSWVCPEKPNHVGHDSWVPPDLRVVPEIPPEARPDETLRGKPMTTRPIGFDDSP